MVFYLTQHQGMTGPIASLLGVIMNALYNALSAIGIENIGLAIILFTIVVNLLMLPLTIRTQRFSKLQQRMAPELAAIRKKYEGKKDNNSMIAQNEEMQQLYAKYGVSQMGTCLPLIIQLPLIFGLYRVIHAIPAYVTKVKDVYMPLATRLIGIAGSADFLQTLDGASMYLRQFTNEAFSVSPASEYAINTYIDVLNRSTSGDWAQIAQQYPDAGVAPVMEKVASMNNFLGLNISNTPSFMMKEALANRSVLLILVAILVPFLAAASQWVSTKLMPQPAASKDPNDPQGQAARQMNSMNVMMPLISAWFCYSLPIGVGIYWIAGAIIRVILQVIINKQIDKMDLDAMIEKNRIKYEQKMEKSGKKTKNMGRMANMNTRNLQPQDGGWFKSSYSEEEKTLALRKAAEAYESGNARKGTLLAIANSVRAYDERNSNGV